LCLRKPSHVCARAVCIVKAFLCHSGVRLFQAPARRHVWGDVELCDPTVLCGGGRCDDARAKFNACLVDGIMCCVVPFLLSCCCFSYSVVGERARGREGGGGSLQAPVETVTRLGAGPCVSVCLCVWAPLCVFL